MLPSSPQVQAVYLGGSGILQALHSSSPTSTSSGAQEDSLGPKLFIDSTTLDVHVARDVSSKMLQAGAEMIDAPVSGGTLPPFPSQLLNAPADADARARSNRRSRRLRRHTLLHGRRSPPLLLPRPTLPGHDGHEDYTLRRLGERAYR